MIKPSRFKWFNSVPELIRRAVMRFAVHRWMFSVTVSLIAAFFPL